MALLGRQRRRLGARRRGLARHAHRAAVEAYGHVNLGFGVKDLRRFLDKAGLDILSSETVTRERRPPHFEVVSLIGRKP